MDGNDDFDFLRLADEPAVHYDERAIHDALMANVGAFMDALERFYLAWSVHPALVDQPKKLIFANDGLKGDWRVMPCVIDRFEGALIKAVKVIGTNEEERTVPDKICVGKALLIDEFDNFVKASFDVCALSSFRTAAISALAFKHATASDGEPVGILGAGRIGFYLATILRSWLGVGGLVFHDINARRAVALSERFAARAAGLDETLAAANAVFVCTDAQSALLHAENAGGVDFISSVGADADNLSELDASLLAGRRLVSESRQNISFGDMSRWRAAGTLRESDLIELTDLIGGARERIPTLFISTGTAVQDALVCDFIHNLPR